MSSAPATLTVTAAGICSSAAVVDLQNVGSVLRWCTVQLCQLTQLLAAAVLQHRGTLFGVLSHVNRTYFAGCFKPVCSFLFCSLMPTWFSRYRSCLMFVAQQMCVHVCCGRCYDWCWCAYLGFATSGSALHQPAAYVCSCSCVLYFCSSAGLTLADDRNGCVDVLFTGCCKASCMLKVAWHEPACHNSAFVWQQELTPKFVFINHLGGGPHNTVA